MAHWLTGTRKAGTPSKSATLGGFGGDLLRPSSARRAPDSRQHLGLQGPEVGRRRIRQAGPEEAHSQDQGGNSLSLACSATLDPMHP